MGVTLFYNAECPDCARQANRTAGLDWLRRVRISTDDSPIGQVPRGEIVVGDHSGIFFHSALNLAMVELVGFVYGLTVALRGRA